MINSYPKVYNLGHSAIQDLFLDDVIIEEKIDGSQFSFGLIDGELQCRSHHQQIDINTPPKMFQKAVDTVKDISLELIDNYIYRCEYLEKRSHNTLTYERTPISNLIVFDIGYGLEKYWDYNYKQKEAERLGLECVPLLHQGMFSGYDEFAKLLEKESCLGGSLIEGVVVKNYSRFGRDSKCLMGKYVSERFKETHNKSWKKKNPGGKDVLQLIIEELKNTVRWEKALLHLKEQGLIVNEPKDIGLLIKEVQQDTMGECEDYVKDRLFDWARRTIERKIITGLPEWYKTLLAKKQFGE